MTNSIEWNLKIALNLTYSLRKFIDVRPTYRSHPDVEKALDNLEKGTWYDRTYGQGDLFSKLEQVLEDNGWIISTQEDSLINLQEQESILTADDQILIKKGCSERNISAVTKNGPYCYFLVAALSCNGKLLYNWKYWRWGREYLTYYESKPYETFYFYYCKITSNSLVNLLNSNKVYNSTYPEFYQVLTNIWNFTTSSANIFNDEEIKNEGVRESEELVQKFEREKADDKEKIQKLELKIWDLELEIEKHDESVNCYQKKVNELQNIENKCSSLENVNQNLIQTIRNKDKEIEELKSLLKTSNETIMLQLNKEKWELQTKINLLEDENSELRSFEDSNKASYSPIYYSLENEIIKLVPNRKHGLPNFGNTCYLNSLLQILASTPLFISKIENIGSQFCNSLLLLLSNMHSDNSSKTISNLTQDFKEALMETYSNIGLCAQQDAKEVFNMILSKVEEDGGNLDIFYAVFHRTFNCQKYYYDQAHRSTSNDIQTFLIIPPKSRDSPDFYLRNQICNPISTQPSFCNGCNSVVDINIKLTRIDWPDYLILYFPTPPNYIKESFYINNEIDYEMYGAICYYQDQGSLHYTACTKDGDEWYEYNDEHVEAKAIDPHVLNLAFYSKKKKSFYF